MRVDIVDLGKVPGFSPVHGMEGRGLFGANVQLTYVTFDPDTVVPIHSHSQEQLGLLLRGSATLLHEDGEVALSELGAYVVPGGALHGLRVGGDGAVFVEAFHPLRQDYLDAAGGRAVTPFQ